MHRPTVAAAALAALAITATPAEAFVTSQKQNTGFAAAVASVASAVRDWAANGFRETGKGSAPRSGGMSDKEWAIERERAGLQRALDSYDDPNASKRQRRDAARSASGHRAAIREIEGWPNRGATASAEIVFTLAGGGTETRTVVYPADGVPPGFACTVVEAGVRLIPATLNLERREPITAIACRP
jgi:hypothetical protein